MKMDILPDTVEDDELVEINGKMYYVVVPTISLRPRYIQVEKEEEEDGY